MLFTLDRYVLRQTAQAFLVGLFALTSIVFIGMAFTLMERGYNIIQVGSVWSYVLLNSLPYAVPVALLCAVVMTFGRMGGDNEILAARSSGVWPDRLGAPVLLLGILLSGASFWLYQWALPSANLKVDQFKETMFQMAIDNLGTREKTYEIAPYQIYVHSVDPDTGEWLHVVIFHTEEGMVRRIMRAERGQSLVSEEHKLARIRLKRCFIIEPPATDQGIEGLEKWLAADDPARSAGDFSGAAVSGPMDMALDVDLSSRRRRNLDKPDLKVLPDLLVEMRAREEAVVGLPEVKRPLTDRHARQDTRALAFRDLRRAQAKAATEKEAAREVEEELRALQTQRRSIHSRRVRLARDMGRIEEQLANLSEERAEIERELEDSPRERGRIEERLAALGAARDTVKEEIASAREKLRAIDAELAAQDRRIASRRGDLAKIEEAIAEAEAEVLANQATFNRLDARYRTAKAHEEYNNALMEFHSRNASAASCLVFVLIGIPLGILANRGNIIYALAFSLGLVMLVYYPLIMVAEMLASDRYAPAAAAFWGPVVVVGTVGVLLQAFAFRR